MMTRTAIHPLKIVAAVGAAFLLWGLVLAYTSSPAQAATITVNSLADTAANDGECTLREAITAANTNTASGAAAGECPAGESTNKDLIDIQGLSGTVQLTGALPTLSTNMDIVGPGADVFTVRRNTGGNYRIFRVRSPAEVSIAGMTITNGKNIVNGGGILNEGTLTVTQSTISGNSAQQGGGIENSGFLTVIESTISGNSASGAGGGIANVGGTLKVERSTVSGNSALNGGGILSFTDLAGLTTTITNSTISGNTANTLGGGVFNAVGLSVIEFSTITNNTAPTDSGSGVGSWGATDTRTEVLSSIISANTNTDVDFVEGSSTNSFDSEGYNLIGDGNATGAFNQTGDQSGVSDPKLYALGNYGGPTQTHALKVASPAINAIPQATNGCGTEITTDQRGVLRPQAGKCEIGSYEVNSPWVRRVVPLENATGVAPATNVNAFFPEAMRASSINSNTVKLFKVGTTTPIGAQVSYDAVGKRALLNPNANLELGTRYRAVVTTGVRDLAGDRLDQDLDPSNGYQPKVWFFTTRN